MIHLKQEYAFIFSVVIDSFLQVAEMVGHQYNQSSCESYPVKEKEQKGIVTEAKTKSET